MARVARERYERDAWRKVTDNSFRPLSDREARKVGVRWWNYLPLLSSSPLHAFLVCRALSHQN